MKIFFKISLFVYFVLSSFLCHAQEGTLRWKFNTQYSDELREDVCLGYDGSIYTPPPGFYALNPDGTIQWSTSYFDVAPVVGTDSTIYITNTSLKAYKPNGILKWSTPVYSSVFDAAVGIALGPDGTIYLGGGDTTLRAFDTQGNPKWTIKLQAITVAVAVNQKYGTIYASSYFTTGSLYAINPNSTIAWQINTDNPFGNNIAIDDNGMIYAGNINGNLYCIYPNGIVKWTYATGGEVVVCPVTGIDGTIYVGSFDNYFYAINPDGTLKWTYLTGGIIDAAATVGNDGIIYFGSYDGYTYALNPDGTLRWKYQASYTSSCPCIGTDGTLYIGCEDGYLYAIHCSSTGLANSTWPRAGHDNQNTNLSGPQFTSTPLFPDELLP